MDLKKRERRDAMISRLRVSASDGTGCFIDPAEVEDLISEITVSSIVKWIRDREIRRSNAEIRDHEKRT